MLYTGILYLDKIFGREKKKLLYRCIPYDKKLSHPLIPYEKKYTFHKKDEPIYILFRYREETRENGILIETIGKISIKENYYLYEYYSLGLRKDSFSSYIPKNLSFQPIEKKERKEKIITIDPIGCKDFDDAISYRKENFQDILSIYISNVPFFLEENDLWKYITKRYSSIYLPHKVIPMLPPFLSENFCSLQEKKNRYVYILEFIIKENKIISYRYFPSTVNIDKNYIYDEPSLLSDTIYKEIFQITKRFKPIHNSHELIEFWMIQTNHFFSNILKDGFKRVTQENKTNLPFFEYKSTYIPFHEKGEHYSLGKYTHITSPIRRIIDLINLTFLQKDSFRKESIDICKSFSIDMINQEIDTIKKIQNRSSWIELLSNQSLKEGKGLLFEKKEKNRYSVFFKDLFLFKNFQSNEKEYTLGEEILFQFIYFPMEGEWSKKFRIEPIEETLP